MGIISNIIIKKQFNSLLGIIQEYTGLELENPRQLDDIPNIEPSELIQVGKYIQKNSKYRNIYIQLIKDNKDLKIKVTVIDQNNKHYTMDESYSLNEDGLKELFNCLESFKYTIQVVNRMIEFDVLLNDFDLISSGNGLDMVYSKDNTEIAHDIKQITRYQTDKHVVFDVQCKEFMVLIIIDKINSKVSDIRIINAENKEAIRDFKAFIENDGISFINYSKTGRIIF